MKPSSLPRADPLCCALPLGFGARPLFLHYQDREPETAQETASSGNRGVFAGLFPGAAFSQTSDTPLEGTYDFWGAVPTPLVMV